MGEHRSMLGVRPSGFGWHRDY